jgi:hypothetical protein
MCAPHQATMLEDCTASEALLLFGIAGFNANPEFLDLYMRAGSTNTIYPDLRKLAEHRIELKSLLLSYPDTPEGGRQALDSLRAFFSSGNGLPKLLQVSECEQTPKKSCCH